eukprot:11287940-Alexandrium_andersonii.AAC.1
MGGRQDRARRALLLRAFFSQASLLALVGPDGGEDEDSCDVDEVADAILDAAGAATDEDGEEEEKEVATEGEEEEEEEAEA